MERAAAEDQAGSAAGAGAAQGLEGDLEDGGQGGFGFDEVRKLVEHDQGWSVAAFAQAQQVVDGLFPVGERRCGSVDVGGVGPGEAAEVQRSGLGEAGEQEPAGSLGKQVEEEGLALSSPAVDQGELRSGRVRGGEVRERRPGAVAVVQPGGLRGRHSTMITGFVIVGLVIVGAFHRVRGFLAAI